jgi:hypothetical protein
MSKKKNDKELVKKIQVGTNKAKKAGVKLVSIKYK